MFNFLSRMFGQKLIQPEPQEGERYVLHDDSPFPKEPVTCIVTGVLNGWVRYCHTDRHGKPYQSGISQSDSSIHNFLNTWKRLS